MSDESSPQQAGLGDRLKKLSPEKRALLDLITSRTRKSGHQLVVQALLANGVTHIYAVSGVPVQELLAAAVGAGIRVIGTRHQQAAVLMAIAHNYVVGKLSAVVVVSAGPAVTNAATGLLVARDNAWPVIVLGGCRKRVAEGQQSFQYLDATELYKSITKWTRIVDKIGDIPRIIDKAFGVATTGRPGPVYLDLPDYVLRTFYTCSSVEPVFSQTVEIAIEQDEIDQVAALLRNAKQPAFILGRGTRWGLVPDDLSGLLEQQHIAFISSPMGRGILPDEHPLCFNRAKHQLQTTADVVVVLGARLNWTFRFGSQINPNAKIIQVDIDPEEVNKNEKVCLGIVADTGDFITRLKAVLHGHPKRNYSAARRLWHKTLEAASEKQRIMVEERCMSNELPMSCYRLMKELKESLPADTILVADGNVSMMAAQHVIPGQTPFSRFTAGTNGCMGVGVPFGIGAGIGDPSRPVVVISGDMAFGISGMEMETAIRCAVKIIVVVINNEGHSGGSTQRALYPEGHERVTMFGPGIRYEQFAEAFGARGEYVEYPEQLRPAIERALKSDRSTCINVKVDPYEKFMSEL